MRRVEPIPLIAAASAGFAAWISIGSLAVATVDTSSRFGFLPPIWLAPVAIIAFVIAAWLLRLSTGSSLPLFFSLIVVLPWIPGRVPAAFLLWTGPVVYVVWMTVAVSMLVAERRWLDVKLRSAPVVAAAVAFAAYLAAGWWLFAILPNGDEPHYLVITQSVVRDGDIRVENNYVAAQYLEYFPGSLRPHYGRGGINRERYSIHAPGLPVLIAPAFALFGYPGVVAFLALIAAGGSALLWRASFMLTGSASAAWFGWAAGALTVPFFFQAFSVYPDGLGATLVLFAALPLVEAQVGRRRWIAVGAALALLPWLHTRFAIISTVLGAVLLLRLVRPPARAHAAAFLALPVASAVGWFAFFRIVYGVFNPAVPYGGNTQTSAGNILTGLPALMFDHQFGIIPNAPVYAVSAAGLLLMARQRPRLALELTALGTAYLLAVSAFHMWWAGSSSPGRFLAPILPLLAIPGAWLWSSASHRSTRAVAAAALVMSLITTAMLTVVQRGVLAFNVRDGYGRAVEWINPVVDVALGMPSFFRQTPGAAVVRASIWVGFVVAATLVLRVLERNGASRRTLAFATPLSLALAIMCAMATVWRIDAVSAANPEKSQMNLLGEYDTVRRPQGVIVGSATLVTGDAALSKITLATPERRGSVPAGTLLLAPAVVPGGVYQLRLAGDAMPSGTAKLIIGRLARPSRVWNLSSDFRDGAATLELAATVGSLVIAGDTHASTPALTLQPVRLWERDSRLTRQIARRVEKYGTGVVFFFDLSAAFPEEAGFWIRGGRAADLVVAAAERDTQMKMFVRNGGAVNTVDIEIDGVKQILELQPREERMVDVSIANHRPGALIRIDSRSGFRPTDVEPGSRDTRFLGVWIELR